MQAQDHIDQLPRELQLENCLQNCCSGDQKPGGAFSSGLAQLLMADGVTLCGIVLCC